VKIEIPMNNIVITPGERLDFSNSPEDVIIEKIRKAYGVIAEVIDLHIQDDMVIIEFKDSTPEKFDEAMGKLKKGVSEAENGKLLKALKLFQEVLSVIPENVDARRNMARVYLDLGNMEKAKKYLFECLQVDPKDAWSTLMLGNIYARNENNLDVGAFFYDKCLEINPDDPMVFCNYAGLMIEKGEFQQAEILFKKAIKIQDIPNAYYGLALLYRMGEQNEAALDVLKTFFTRCSSVDGIEKTPIFGEARKLYKELSEALKTDLQYH
jgi:tetratricopeptide (TPR) repeat protein